MIDEVRKRIGAVAIGRNEGDRLKACLLKLVEHFSSIVYVDSGSTDGSVSFAKSIGVHVLELDTRIPFNAARARNAAWKQLTSSHPQLEWMQFVDGDCELVDGWLEAALRTFESSSKTAIVCGRRRERFPKASIYNRMMDLEWNTPIGPAEACGGDSLVRVQALRDVGGFNETVAAGEEPEMCKRLRETGWEIVRIDAEMTLHDAAMKQFSQWWRRQRRSGYGALDVTQRFGLTSFRHELRSARAWTMGWIMITVTMALGFAWFLGWIGIGIGLLAGISMFATQVFRIAWRQRHSWSGMIESLQYASILMISKFACMHGQLLWWLDHWNGRHSRQIEYKDQVVITRQASKQS